MKIMTYMLITILLLCTGFAMAADSIGRVVAVQKKVTATGTDEKIRDLSLKSPIYLNDTIKSGKGAKVQIIFTDDSIFSQGENSEMVIDRYVFDPDKKKKNSFFIRLGKGLFRVITGKITDLNPDRFEVNTGRATVGIRGCELGFHCDEKYDTIFVVRIPDGKNVFVDPSKGRDGGEREVMLDSAGVVIVGDLGSVRTRGFRSEDMRMISIGTTPSGLKDDKPGVPGVAGIHPGKSPPLRMTTAGFGLRPAADGRHFEDKRNLRALRLRQAKRDARKRYVRLAELGGEIDKEKQTVDHNTTPATTPPDGGGVLPPPNGDGDTPDFKETAPFMGGGEEALYALAGTSGMAMERSRLGRHHSIEFAGVPGDLTDVTFMSYLYDKDDSLMGEAIIDRNVTLPDFGGSDRYTGYREIAQPPASGVFVAYDNLEQFVRRTAVDEGGNMLSVEYWGFAAPPHTLPANATMKYDFDFSAYPPEWDGNNSPNDLRPFDLQKGLMIVNTKTRAFYLFPEDPDLADDLSYGSLNDLTFFGEFNQGVAGKSLNLAFGKNATAVGAGFRSIWDPGGPAESGMSGMWRGYAVGIIDNGSNNSHPLISASMMSDNPVDNENMVQLSINRDTVGNNVDASLSLYEYQGTVSPNDVALNNPVKSFFVDGNLYGAEFSTPGETTTILGDPDPRRAGEHWSWGFWNGERAQINSPGGSEHMRGEYVAGNVLAAADINTLRAASVTRSLSGRGVVSAHVTMDQGRSIQMEGDSFIRVALGGGAATWQGAFNMSSRGSDVINLQTRVIDISAQGHLKVDSLGDINSFSGNIAGTQYTGSTDLTDAKMTGNLVGAHESNNTRVTGAIGSGRLKTMDYKNIDMLYATELRPE